MENIYANIAARTGGNIYIGVVGPVRTGKSTLIKRFMETLVIPNIDDPYRKERARDELPQSGSGKTIMTSEPKFIPEEAVEISPDGTSQLRIRMIDSVGYMVEGAVGAEEDGVPRMVATPWYDTVIPLAEAAELGTQKVMQEHCSIGLVVTTDGTITDIPRKDYVSAESRAITDMQKTGKPFLVIINSQNPRGEAAQSAAAAIGEKFGIRPMIVDCQSMTLSHIGDLLQHLLYNFALQELRVHMPRWIESLEYDHPIKETIFKTMLQQVEDIDTLGKAETSLPQIKELDFVENITIREIDPAEGIVSCYISLPEKLFYEILSNKAGIYIKDDAHLFTLLTDLSRIKREYDKVADALSSVKATGYGIVMPAADEMTLEPPEVIRKGSAYGIKLKAGAPSIHMVRVDIDTEITPMVGGEQQSQDLIQYLTEETPEKLWHSNIFGKSVYTLIQDGLNTKLVRTPDDVRIKFRDCLTRIVNEGANGLICLIL